MYRNKLLKTIKSRISSSMSIYGLGIDGGVGGISLFHALYSFIFKSNEDFDRCLHILHDTEDLYNINYGILNGSLGLALAIDVASRYGLKAMPERLLELKNFGVSKYIEMYQLSPIKYIHEDDFFSEGMYMLYSYRLGVGSELEYYYMLERMIGEVDTCQTYMTLEVEGMYKSSDISILNLSSLINYLTKMIEWRIYPYKARVLLEMAIGKMNHIKPQNALEFILKTIYVGDVNRTVDKIPWIIDSQLLSKAGILSLIFGEALIFEEALKWGSDFSVEECSDSELLGIGLGYEMLIIADSQKT